jgi:hypothetical protein
MNRSRLWPLIGCGLRDSCPPEQEARYLGKRREIMQKRAARLGDTNTDFGGQGDTCTLPG